jgi:aspartate-semialdehyde dehydrogenase
LALIGATGLVGRACATYVAAHPELNYRITHFVGSSESEGKILGEVADEKESKLRSHYGDGFWESDEVVDSAALMDAMVSGVDALLREGPAGCDVVLSFLAPRFGDLEDKLVAQGFRVVSISPHARMAHPLVVPVVNCNSNGAPLDLAALRCIKSPNCCSVGTSVALLPLVDAFTVSEVFITTFQTLSGRGDALSPPDKVVKNVYPIGATEEKTELYIAQEVSRIFAQHPRGRRLSRDSFHVSAYRVYVQKNHLLDIRVRIQESVAPASARSMLAALYAQAKYAADVVVEQDAGQPRPRSHADPLRVTVGNFDVEHCPGGGSFIRVSATVDNVAKGAWGNALDITDRIVKACASGAASSGGRSDE